MLTKLTRGILKGVIAMAMADGELQAGEREMLAFLKERFDLEDGELDEAIGDAKRLGIDELRKRLDHDDRVTVAQYAVMAAWADGHVQKKERKFLEDLEHRLGLSAADIRRLESMSRELARVASKRPVDVEALNDVLDSFP